MLKIFDVASQILTNLSAELAYRKQSLLLEKAGNRVLAPESPRFWRLSDNHLSAIYSYGVVLPLHSCFGVAAV
jgi:hypothetical protein